MQMIEFLSSAVQFYQSINQSSINLYMYQAKPIAIKLEEEKKQQEKEKKILLILPSELIAYRCKKFARSEFVNMNFVNFSWV